MAVSAASTLGTVSGAFAQIGLTAVTAAKVVVLAPERGRRDRLSQSHPIHKSHQIGLPGGRDARAPSAASKAELTLRLGVGPQSLKVINVVEAAR